MYAPDNTAFVRHENTRIAYYTDGDPEGIPLVLLHGFCEDSSMWEAVPEDVADCRLIMIDLSGFGNSELRPNYTIEWLADSVRSVLDELQIARAVVIGHSMGGYVGVAFAAKYPERLLGLGLFHSHPFEDSAEKKNDRQKSMQFIQANNHVLYLKQLIPNLFAPPFVSSNRLLIDKLILQATAYGPAAIIAALEAMKNRPGYRQVLSDIRVPVLFIIGGMDKTIPAEWSLEQTILPAIADIHILPKEAHMGMYQYRKVTNMAMESFAKFCLSIASGPA